MSKSPQIKDVRVDIQALRALAILSVVIFHLWPDFLTGGFVGVDIFFVISGYLITGHLFRQVEKTGSVNFKDFWARRARRLLPASLLVIAVTTLATYLFTTASWFIKIKGEAYASVFYIQNWALIGRLTDYMRNDGTETPFQHFWSLSVEEQYYIFWPMVLFLVLLISRFLPKRWSASLVHRNVLTVVLAVMFMASIIYSTWQTHQLQENAYFNTFTRAWEFAAGAILAVAIDGRPATKTNRSGFWFGAGLSLMLISVFGLNTGIEFPSFIALVPVTGAVLALYGGNSTSKWVPTKLLAFKPIQFFGDISYSFYLWHYPVLILAPWILSRELDFTAKVVCFLLAMTLGWASKKFVEDPVRFGPLSRLKLGRQLMAAGVGMVLVFAGAYGLGQLAKVTLANNIGNTALTPPLSDLNAGAKAKESGFCQIPKDSGGWLTCQKGDPKGTIRVALIGDSHTRQYFVPVDDLAFKYHWNVTMISKSACTVLDPKLYPANLTHFTCEGWNQKLSDYLAKQPPFDLIINSNSSLVTQGRSDVAAAYKSLVAKVTARGTQWLVIHDSPKPAARYAQCIETWGLASQLKCAYPKAQAMLPADPTAPAVKGMKNVIVADPTDQFCDSLNCPPVIGKIIVYRDNSHITTTWAKHLEPWLESFIPAEFKK